MANGEPTMGPVPERRLGGAIEDQVLAVRELSHSGTSRAPC